MKMQAFIMRAHNGTAAARARGADRSRAAWVPKVRTSGRPAKLAASRPPGLCCYRRRQLTELSLTNPTHDTVLKSVKWQQNRRPPTLLITSAPCNPMRSYAFARNVKRFLRFTAHGMMRLSVTQRASTSAADGMYSPPVN